MRRICGFLVTAILFTSTSAAHAHFLFTRICPPAEGGRFAEVYFSEYARAGDPRYIAKVAPAEFQVQTAPGQWRALPMRRLDDRLRAHLPTTGPLVVAGKLDFGALDRPGSPTFLLRHYSKAVTGAPDELNAMAPLGTPVELVAKFEAERIVLTALQGGQPLADTRIDIVDADLASEELKTDARGQAVFTPAAPSLYCIYVGHTIPTAGEHAGKAFAEIKQFATLSFEWPLVSEPNDAAIALFEEAVAARATWKNFPGFSAEIAGELDGRPFSGTVTVAADGAVEVTLGEDAVMATWVDDQLESITMHRAAGQTEDATKADRAKPSIRFADSQTDHPLGRLVAFEGGQFASSYRVKDRQLMTVNRLIEGENVTIAILENEQNSEGKFLPRAYTVQAWDETTGAPTRTETVRDSWTRVDAWDLPAEHTVTNASADGFSVRTFRLSKHATANAKKS
jgi:hypothetical protein